MGKKGKRYSPRFQFQVVLEVLKGDRDAVEIARAHNIHPTTVSRWKQEYSKGSYRELTRKGSCEVDLRRARLRGIAIKEMADKCQNSVNRKRPLNS